MQMKASRGLNEGSGMQATGLLDAGHKHAEGDKFYGQTEATDGALDLSSQDGGMTGVPLNITIVIDQRKGAQMVKPLTAYRNIFVCCLRHKLHKFSFLFMSKILLPLCCYMYSNVISSV